MVWGQLEYGRRPRVSLSEVWAPCVCMRGLLASTVSLCQFQFNGSWLSQRREKPKTSMKPTLLLLDRSQFYFYFLRWLITVCYWGRINVAVHCADGLTALLCPTFSHQSSPFLHTCLFHIELRVPSPLSGSIILECENLRFWVGTCFEDWRILAISAAYLWYLMQVTSFLVYFSIIRVSHTQ